MSLHLHRAIEDLKKHLLGLSALVEEALGKAVTALERRDEALARQVIEGDRAIDLLEVELEEECLKCLALHQPVASDLRFVIAVLKMDDELERIGDLAVNLAQRALVLAGRPPLACPFDLHGMAEKARWMLGRSLDALINLDADLAREVWGADREVDAIHRATYEQVAAAMRDDPDRIESYLQYISASRFIERIADHATNIAKDVLYMTVGEIVRHRGREFRTRPGTTPPGDPEPG